MHSWCGIRVVCIKLRRSTLYFTNSTQGLARIEINHGGKAAGKAIVIANAAAGATYDDFALDWRGDPFIATGPCNAIEMVGRGVDPRAIIARNINTTEIAEPTAAQSGGMWGDRDILYATMGGVLIAPVEGDEIIGGQLLAADTNGLREALAARWGVGLVISLMKPVYQQNCT